MPYVQLESGTILQTDDPARWPEAKRLTNKVGAQLLKDEAVTKLRKEFAPRGDKRKTLYTTVTHVARSGMSRSIRCFAQSKDADGMWDVSHLVARAIGAPMDEKNGGLKVGGCGMDMGFHVCHSLGYALFPKGTKKPHGRRNGTPDTDGGYAINHRWL
jgi:hypothetical protein